MEIGGSSFTRANAARPTGQAPANATASRMGETVSGLASYDRRPRPDTVYPAEPEPIGEPNGGYFFLEFPEIRLTPKLKEALSLSLKIDFQTEGTTIEISGGRKGTRIEASGRGADKWLLIPLARRLFGMLQAGFTPDEYAELLVLFDNAYTTMADGKGGVGFFGSGNNNDEKYPSQYHIARHNAECISKLLELKCPDLAREALVMMYNGFIFHTGGSDDKAKYHVRQIVCNQAWKGWAEEELAKIE